MIGTARTRHLLSTGTKSCTKQFSCQSTRCGFHRNYFAPLWIGSKVGRDMAFVQSASLQWFLVHWSPDFPSSGNYAFLATSTIQQSSYRLLRRYPLMAATCDRFGIFYRTCMFRNRVHREVGSFINPAFKKSRLPAAACVPQPAFTIAREPER